MMEDSSLDNFFAKKDKSKKLKSKNKFKAQPQEVTTASQDKAQQSHKATTTAASALAPSSTSTTSEAAAAPSPRPTKKEKSANASEAQDEAEDWKDFEVETEKDYSGLRVHSLQTTADTEEDGDERQQDNGEDGEGERKRDTSSGPWSKSKAVPESAPAVVEEAEPPSQPAAPQKYVPPSMRRLMASGGRRGPRKGPPQIESEEQFPSLSSAPKDAPKTKTKGPWQSSEQQFETVRFGYKSTPDQTSAATGPKLHLGNQYDALSAGD